jgi:hypothetical protein
VREKAVNALTDEKLLLEITNGDEADFITSHTVESMELEDDTMEMSSGYSVSYGGTRKFITEEQPLDLREVAKRRLEKL